MAREYFWIYGGGALLVLVGFAAGAAGVLLEVSGPRSWSRRLEGWFPLEPWPAGYQWLAFLVVGIVLSVAGIGITRRRASAWGSAAALLLYEAAWTILALLGLRGGDGARGAAGMLLVIEGTLFLLLVRIGISLRRTRTS